MKTNQTTTRTPAALLPAVTLTRATRTAAAASRHPLTTCPTWHTTPDGVTVPDLTTAAPYLYGVADMATFFALRARHEKSGVKLFADLMNAAREDQNHRSFPAIGAAALEAERTHAAAVADLAVIDSIARSQTASPADVTAAAIMAEALRQTRNTARQQAEQLAAVIGSSTASDREQLAQAAILWAVEHWDEVQQDPAGIVRGMTNAAGRAISDLAAPDALRSTRTFWQPITEAEAAADKAAHPDIMTIDPLTGEETASPAKVPFNVRQSSAAGYYEIRYTNGSKPRKDGTQARPAGWYRVNHYHTEAPYMSYEVFAAGEATAAAIVKNDGVNAIDSQSAAEQIEALCTRANLTAKEREVVAKLTDNTARRAAEQAHHEAAEAGRQAVAAADKSHKARTKARAEAAAEAAYTAALWDSAFTRCAVYAKSTRSDYRRRICAALDKARTAPADLTAEEREERTRKHWEREQRNSRRGGGAIAPASRADIAAAVAAWAEAVPVKPVCRWTQSGQQPQALTTEEAAAEASARERERLEHISSHAAEIARLAYRRENLTSHRRPGTAWAALDAQHAARIFWDSMTPAEQDETIRAAQQERAAAEAAAAEAARRQSFPAWVYSLDTTFAIWRKATEAEKAEHMAYLEDLARSH